MYLLIQSIWRVLYTLFFQTLPYWLLALFLFLAVSLWRHKKQHKPFYPLRESALLLLVLWMVGISMMTFVPRFSIDFVASSGRLEWDSGIHFGILSEEINFIPFRVFADLKNAWTHMDDSRNQFYVVANILCNLVMLAPLGFFLPLLWGKFTFSKTLLAGLGYSLLIETCQLFEQGAKTDIDDVWMNVLGVIGGYTVFWLIQKAAPALTARFRLLKPQAASG